MSNNKTLSVMALLGLLALAGACSNPRQPYYGGGGYGGYGMCFANNPTQTGCDPNLYGVGTCVACQTQTGFPPGGGYCLAGSATPCIPGSNPQCRPCASVGLGVCGDGIVTPPLEQCEPAITPGCSQFCTFGGAVGGIPGAPGLSAYPLSCGDEVQFSTISLTSGIAFTDYVCIEQDNDEGEIWTGELGPENIFVFSSFGFQEVELDIDDENGANIDVFVLADYPDPSRCIMAATNDDEFFAEPGRLYYVVMDSVAGHEGEYRLEVDCDYDCDDCDYDD
jgi:hypothetical protein